MKELLNTMIDEQDIIEELIKIDNDIMNTKYTYDDYYNAIESVLINDVTQIRLKTDTVFVTEGDVLLTLDILRRFCTDCNLVIFVNQSNVAMNKWLVTKYSEIIDNSNIRLDTDINYNKYIEKGYQVIPLGEDGLVEQVMEDFYDKG